MNYQKWNDCLFSYFFNIYKKSQTVLLDISEQDICEVYSKIFEVSAPDPNVAITSLISALNTGPTIYHSRSKSEQKFNSLCEKIKDGFFWYYCKNNQSDIRLGSFSNVPPFFAYAIGLVYGLKVSTKHKLYDAFRSFLGKNLRQVGSDDDLRHCIEIIWKTIEDHLEDKQGKLGYFFNKRDGPATRRYVDKVYSQFIIPRTELLRMPNVFWELNLTREDANKVDIPIFFLSKETILKRLIPTTLALLKQQNDDKLLAGEVVNTLLQSFDGWSPKVVEKTGLITAEHNLAKLWLSIERSRKTGDFEISYHFSLPGFDGSHIIFAGQEVFLNEAFWSSQIRRNDGLNLDFPFSMEDKINGIKIIFKPEDAKMYVFSGAMDKGFPSHVTLQNQYICRPGKQFLLLHDSLLAKHSTWIALNKGTREVVSAFGWSLWLFNGISIEGNVEPLRFSAIKRFAFQGGLKAKGSHSYVLGFPLKLVLDGAKGDEELFIGTLKPILYNSNVKAFEMTGIELPGEYDLVVRSPTEGDLNMGSCSRLQIVATYGVEIQQAMEMEIDKFDTYERHNTFMAYQHLQKSGVVQHQYPPQLLEWEAQETDLKEGGYSWLAQELLSYIAYRGEMSKAVLSENLIAFFHRYCLIQESLGLNPVVFDDFKRKTIWALTEGCRLVPTYNEIGSLIKVTPLFPFLCRLINASSVNSGLKNRATIPFGGELYFLGGCVPIRLIREIKSLTETKYLGQVTIKFIGEEETASLNPPGAYIFIHRRSDFLEVIVNQFRIKGPNNCYSLFPVIGTIQDKLMEASSRPGMHQDFHDPESCETFSEVSLRFAPLNGHELAEVSLCRYKVNSYRSVTLLRNGNVSSNVKSGWGKYLYLHLLKQEQGQIHYDPSKNVVAFRTTLSLPWPLNKVFYLATGRLGHSLPMAIEGKTLVRVELGSYFTIYQGIEEATASSVFSRLGQKFGSENYINIQLTL